MSQADCLDNTVRPRHIARPCATTQPSGVGPVWLGWDHLLRHPRLEPILRKMFPDQRRDERFILPNVVGYLGRVHSSRPHQIANISSGGFCMVSDDHWTPGTEMPITLQREDWDGDESCERITVQAIVVRLANREVGFSIARSAKESTAFSDLPSDSLWINKAAIDRFLENLKKPKPPRILSVSCSNRPLSLAERTQRLLEIAKLHTVSGSSEFLHTRG
jgi:hypothetical protein